MGRRKSKTTIRSRKANSAVSKTRQIGKRVTRNTSKKTPESYWNYRVMARLLECGEPWFAMHEVYYKNGRPKSYSTDPISIHADTLKEFKWTLKVMKEALKKPILWWGEGKFPKVFKVVKSKKSK